MSNITSGWYKTYRPTTIDRYIFQSDADERNFKKYIADGDFPDLLLEGHRGTGKTTLSYILKEALNIPDIDFLVMNASDSNSVDDIRHTVKPFINTLSLSKFRLVVMDEADALTQQAQEALKSMIEDPDLNARFILICNKPYKIIPELHSRLTEYKFSALDKNSMRRIALEILVDNGLDLKSANSAELMNVLDAHLTTSYPDLRKFINSIEKGFHDNELFPPSYNEKDLELLVEMLVLIEAGDWRSIRDIIYEDLPSDEIGNVYRFLDSNMHEVEKFNSTPLSAKAYLTLAHYAAQHDIAIIPELNLTACTIKLCEL